MNKSNHMQTLIVIFKSQMSVYFWIEASFLKLKSRRHVDPEICS